MAYPHNLRAPVNSTRPEPTGVCDRCYFYYPLVRLMWQYDYRGRALQNLRIRVCPRCLDKPNPQLQPVVILGPEGTVKDPRPPAYAQQAAEGSALLFGDVDFTLDSSTLDGPDVLA